MLEAALERNETAKLHSTLIKKERKEKREKEEGIRPSSPALSYKLGTNFGPINTNTEKSALM